MALAHETVSAQAFLLFGHLTKSQGRNWLSGSFVAFSGYLLPEALGDLLCYLARREKRTTWDGTLFPAKEINPAE